MPITQSLNKRSIIPLDSLMLDIDAENVIGNVALDASPFGNNGIINGGVSVVDGIGGGKAFLFDGSTGYIDFGNILGFERTDSFSVSCWVKYNSKSDYAAIFSKVIQGGTYAGYQCTISPTVKIGMYLINTHPSNMICISSLILSSSIWYHLVFTYDGSSSALTTNIYLNGILSSKTINNNTLTATIQNTINFIIGSRNGSYPFSGYIQNFKLFNKELNPQEVRTLYDEYRVGEIILYSNEVVGNTGSPTVAQVTFTPISIPDLESFVDKGYLKIDMKCTNYANLRSTIVYSCVELGSLTSVDVEEWYHFILPTYSITDSYQTFYFPLKSFSKQSTFRSYNIQRIRVYFYFTTGTGQVSWKNASIIL